MENNSDDTLINSQKRIPIVVNPGETGNKFTTWSPLMDHIVQISSSNKSLADNVDEIDSKIDRVLYSSKNFRRLPIFEEMCPSSSASS